MQMRTPAVVTIPRRALVLALLIGIFALAAQTPPPAAQVLDEAKAQAAAGQKNIFLIFHASWCGWCKKLDTFIETPENKAIINRYFVVTHLTVKESGDYTVFVKPF